MKHDYEVTYGRRAGVCWERRTASKAGGLVDHRISRAFEPLSSRHQDRNRHLRQQGSSDAAEDDLGPPRMAVGADDDQIHVTV